MLQKAGLNLHKIYCNKIFEALSTIWDHHRVVAYTWILHR